VPPWHPLPSRVLLKREPHARRQARATRREPWNKMILLHALWHESLLHLCGERVAEPAGGAPSDPPDPCPPSASWCPAEGELRPLVAELWESLLAMGATTSRLTLKLPHIGGMPVSSVASPDARVVTLEPVRVETLAFPPADAVDLLTALPSFPRQESRAGDSLRFWARVAQLVLELLARQRFVPDIHMISDEQHRGLWRVVVNDDATSRRIRQLIGAMPPVCRAVAAADAEPQASELLENFLWTTVDAIVRRCMEGDELAHALQTRSAESQTPETRWLRALVGVHPLVQADVTQGRAIFRAVREWVDRLEPVPTGRTFRTGLVLHSPPGHEESGAADGMWLLRPIVQSLDEPDMLLEAKRLWDEQGVEPRILCRPFDGAREQMLQDLERGARFFPPLERLARQDPPISCELTTAEAYHFLRDAVPILEHEGFATWVPRWWRGGRERLGLRLHLRPVPQPDSGAAMLGLDALVQYDWRLALGDGDLTPEEISALAHAQAPLVRLRNGWIEAQAEHVHSALRFLEKHREGRMTVFEALRHSYRVDDFDTGLPVLGISAEDWLDRLLRATEAEGPLEAIDPPATFRGVLRPYQRRGLAWLWFLNRYGLGACLADDMGLGKTIQLIALLLQERADGAHPGPTLLVVPMSLVGNWQREAARFAPELQVLVHHGLDRLSGDAFLAEAGRSDMVVSTYGLLHRDLEHLRRVEWHRLALDEAQNIKNPASKQATAARQIAALHRVVLTGTPVENRLSDLWSIMEFLNTGYLGSASEFRRRFAVPIERHRDSERADQLRRLIRPFVLRRLKNDPAILADLPEKMEMRVYCNLTREQASLYEAVVAQMLGQIEQSSGIARRGLILAALVKLKQICDHPALFLGERSAAAHRSGKCDRLAEMLQEVVAEGDRALVFTQFRQMGELLQGVLHEELDAPVLLLHGGSTKNQRDAMVERFQSATDVPVFILSLKAGGFGLNLTAASHVFHFDRWWNPAVEQQATDRAHRIGQLRQVQVHKYVCVGTLEERIDAMLEQKKTLADRVVGGGEDWLTELSTDALRDLFRLSRDAVAEE
jgi:hypothetical protein